MTKTPPVRKDDVKLCDSALLERWLYGVPPSQEDQDDDEKDNGDGVLQHSLQHFSFVLCYRHYMWRCRQYQGR